MKKLSLLLTVAAILLGIGSLSAATKTWAGGTSTDWNTGSNWSPAGVPASGDNIIFNGTGTYQPLMNANRTAVNITVSGNTINLNGYTLTITGTTSLTGGTINNGTITFSNTTTTFAGTTFGAKVVVTATDVFFNGSTFNGVVDATRSGSGTTSSTGGNTFNDSLKLKNTGAGLLRMYYGGGNDAYNGHLVVSCTNTGGVTFGAARSPVKTGTLASGKTITIGSSGFTNGTLALHYFTQSGSTAQSLTLTSSATLQLGDVVGGTSSTTIWNGNTTFSAPNVLMANSTFNGSSTITKTGSSSNTCIGNNTFNSTATFNVNGTGYLTLANTTGDTYNGAVNYNLTSSATIYPANNGTNNYYGNVAVATNNINVTFNNGSGTSIFTGSSSQALTQTGTGIITISRLTMNKASNHLTISSPINISTTFTLTSGKIIATNATDTVRVSASSMPAGSSTSYVDGVICYKMNGSSVNQTFPSGNSSIYQPLSIVNTGGMSGDYKFAARYYAVGQSQGSSADTSVSNLSTCEYWKLNQVGGTSVALNVTLGWKSTSCNGAKPANMRVSRWTGSQWVNEGNGANTGNNTAGTVRTASGQSTLGYFTIANKTCTYAATITPTGATSFCSGGSVLLTANSSKYYNWSTSATTQAITASTGGTYSVTVRDTSGCKGTANQAVTVWSLPTVNAGVDTVIVKGDTLQLNTSVSSGTAPYSYLWTPSTALSSTTIANPLAYPDTLTTYVVRVTDVNGCIKRDTIKIWALKLSFTLSNDTIEAGDSVVFTNTSILAGGTTYYWDFGDCNYTDTTYHNWDRCKDTIVGTGSAKYFYDNEGNFEVTLRVMGPLGYLVVVPNPINSGPIIGPPGVSDDCGRSCPGYFNTLAPGRKIQGAGQINRFKSCWRNIRFCDDKNGTPDAFHTNATTPNYDVPFNAWGTEDNSESPTGGYVGIITYNSGTTMNREYITSHLGNPIAPNESVQIQIRVSLADCAELVSEFQILFTETQLCQDNGEIPDFDGVVNSGLLSEDLYYNQQHGITQTGFTSIVTETDGWTTLTYNYTNTTASTLEWVTIGNFIPNNVTQQFFVGNSGYTPTVPCISVGSEDLAYYYFDNLLIDKVQCCTGSDVTITNRTASSLLDDPDFDLFVSGDEHNMTITNSYPGGSSWTTIAINGTFTIDVPSFTFENCNIVLGTNSRIDINGTYLESRTVIVEDSWLHACEGYLWDGIYINNLLIGAPNKSLVVLDSKFEDAKNAIVSVKGGPYTISGSTFNKNYKGILVNQYKYPHAATVVSSTFECTSGILRSFDDFVLPIKSTNHIELNNVRSIVIGNDASSTFRNYFTNAIDGVYNNTSGVRVRNCTFEGFNSFNSSPYLHPSGTGVPLFNSAGIKALGTFQKFTSLDVQSASPTDASANMFLNGIPTPDIFGGGFFACNGIFTQNFVSSQINNNYFDNVYIGVSVYNNNGQNVTIGGNDFLDVNGGIETFVLFGSNNNINISGNTMNWTTPAFTESFGIGHSNSGFIFNGNYAIDKNTINDYRWGINGYLLSTYRISENNIKVLDVNALPEMGDFLPASQAANYGMYLNRFVTGRVVSNNLKGYSGSTPTNNNPSRFEAMRFIFCPQNLVYCNNINVPDNSSTDIGTLGRGIMFEQFCNPCKLAGNSIGDCEYGVGLVNTGNIGQQLDPSTPSDNRWLNGPITPNGTLLNNTYTFNTNANNPADYFYVRNVANFYPPTADNNTNGFNTEAQLVPISGPEFDCTVRADDAVITEAGLKSRARQIINDTTTYLLYNTEGKFLDKMDLYRFAMLYPDSITGDTLVEDYIDSLSTTSIGDIYSIEYLLGVAFYDSVYALPDTIYEARDSVEFDVQWFVPDSMALVDAYDLLDNLTPANAPEETYKVVNTVIANALMRIYFPLPGKELNTFNIAEVLTNTEIDTLIYYADKCELWYGDGVYAARSILIPINDTLKRYYMGYRGNCEPDSGGMRLSHFDEDILHKAIAKIYPNPTGGNLFVELPKDINRATIQVFNALGTFLHSTVANGQITELNLNSYTNGLYIIRIFDSSGKEIESKKISLQR